MQSLRNKISHSPSRAMDIPNDYIQPVGELNPNFEEDYPHPKNGTLKNELLNARLKMSNRKQTPKEWKTDDYPRRHEPARKPSVKSDSHGYPPKDYPGFPAKTGSGNPPFTRRPFSPHNVDSNVYSPSRPQSYRPGGMSKQENDVMAVYDQTIANEERGYGVPYQANKGFLHNRNNY